MNRNQTTLRMLSMGVLATLLAACGDSTSPNAKTVSLSFGTRSGAPAVTAMGAGISPQIVVSSASGDNVTITRAQVVLREIELTSADTTACLIEGGEAECQELKLGPVLVDLPVSGELVSTMNVAVPAGSYTEVEFEVHHPEDGDEDDDTADRGFLALHPDFRGVSVRVEGTYNGQPFVYTLSSDAELELDFAPPLVVDAAASNITVNVDVARWFRSSTGAVLAPTVENKSLIAENVKASFEAYEDDDRDGDSDR